MNTTNSNRYSVPALEKSLLILETLASSNQHLSVAELTSLVGLPKSSVFGILTTLEEHGYIEKTYEGKYSLTLKIYELGYMVVNKLDIRKEARPIMEELAEQLDFTIHLASLVDGKAVYIEKVQGPAFVQFSTHIGQAWHLHISGVGKAIAAYLPKKSLEMIVQKHGLPSMTENTVTSLKDLHLILENVRKNGYAIEDEEGENGVRCIAAPIFDRDGNVIGALGITSVRANLPAHRFNEIGQIVKEKASLISNKIGFRPDR